MPPAQRKNAPDLSALKITDTPAEDLSATSDDTDAETSAEESVLDRRVTALGDTVEALSNDVDALGAALTKLAKHVDSVLDAVYGTGVRPALSDEDEDGGDNT